MSNKYSQKFVDAAKKSATDAIKTASKKAIQKTAETTGDLVGNKVADKITSASKNHIMKKITKNSKFIKSSIKFDDTSNQPSKFRTKNWVEMMNQEEHAMLIVKSNLKLQC